MIFVSASSTARTTAWHSGSENPSVAAGGLPDATSVQIIHGIPPAATCPEVSHAYTKPGTYQAMLTAIGLGGLSTENSFRLPVSGSVSTRFVPTEKRRYRP